nr:MAG TPA: hypothetical protein [Bacteriophage sp.]
MFLYFRLFPCPAPPKICNKKITKHHLINPCFFDLLHRSGKNINLQK